jgi:hypothetical protein
MDKNQQVLAVAFKRTKRKLARIKDLGITPDMPEDAIDKIVVDLATAKALDEKGDVKDYLDGQQWYVESLIKASALEAADLLEAEYNDSFADVASEDDMVNMLEAFKAA